MAAQEQQFQQVIPVRLGICRSGQQLVARHGVELRLLPALPRGVGTHPVHVPARQPWRADQSVLVLGGERVGPFRPGEEVRRGCH
ncbi:MAG: hypothetical protein ACRDP8_23770 [Actinopolymorphaceae bacterium]